MILKFISVVVASFLLYATTFASHYIIKKDGVEHECSVVTDNNDNEILFANTEEGPVLIPFSELEKLEVLEKESTYYILQVTYKDKSQEIVNVDLSLSLMCKNGVGKVALDDISYVSFLKNNSEAVVVETVKDEPIDTAVIATAEISEDTVVTVEEVIDTVVAIEEVVDTVTTVVESLPVVDSVEAVLPIEPVIEEVAIVEEVVEEPAIVEEIIEEPLVEEAIVEEVIAEPMKEESVKKQYTVKKHDTLWDLATRFYNNPYQWKTIWDNNSYIADPDLIYPGDMLSVDNMYVEEKSLVYNEDIATGQLDIKDRVVTVPVSEKVNTGLFAMKSVSMFLHEVITEDEVDTLEQKGDNLFEIIEKERYPTIFSYAYFSKLGDIVQKDYEGQGKVYSRSKDDHTFIKSHATVRITLGTKKGVKINDKYVVFDLMKDTKDKRIPAYLRRKGEVKVIKVFTDYSVATVTRYFGQGLMKNNDRIFKKNKIEVPRVKKLSLLRKDITTRIVGPVRSMGRAITQTGDMFVVDKGLSKDIEVGQVFEVYTKHDDGFTDLPVGEVYVVKTFDDYAIVQLDNRWSDTVLKKGDLLQHKLTFEMYNP